MEAVFSKVLSMSVSSSVVVIVVLLLRLLLKKAPRKYVYFLWLLVFFRLLYPFHIESVLSLVPAKEYVIFYEKKEEDSVGEVKDRRKEEDSVGEVEDKRKEEDSVGEVEDKRKKEDSDFVDMLWSILPNLWIVGIMGLTAYTTIQMISLKYRLRTATLLKKPWHAIKMEDDGKVFDGQELSLYFQGQKELELLKNITKRERLDNQNFLGQKNSCRIYESEDIPTAFLLGIFKPCIYLPMGMEKEQVYVIAHELMHKKRLDHIIKPICYLAVIFHWFNPFAWLSFYLMMKDMEIACDEQVLKLADADIRRSYAASLLNMSAKRSGLNMSLAFGESNTKERICHVLGYKKPSTWIGIGAIVVLFVAGIILLPNVSSEKQSQKFVREDISWEEMNNGEGKKYQEKLFQELSKNRNLYIGNNGADGKLIGLLPELSGYEYGGISLQTQQEPYELTIVYEKVDIINVEEEKKNVDTMWINALFLFATIENMDICNFAFVEDAEAFLEGYSKDEIARKAGEKGEIAEKDEGKNEIMEEVDGKGEIEEKNKGKDETIEGADGKGEVAEKNEGKNETTEEDSVAFTNMIESRSYNREYMEELYGELYVRSETPEGLQQLKKEDENFQKRMKQFTSSTFSPISLPFSIRENMDLSNEESAGNEGELMDKESSENVEIVEGDLELQIEHLISQAILDYMKKLNGAEKELVESHIIMGGQGWIFQELTESDREIECYLLVKCAVAGNVVEGVWGNQEMKVLQPGQEDRSYVEIDSITYLRPLGGCFPAKVVIDITKEGKLKIKEFWTPRKKDLLEEDIKAVFPEEFWEEAITMEKSKVILESILSQKGIEQLNLEKWSNNN